MVISKKNTSFLLSAGVVMATSAMAFTPAQAPLCLTGNTKPMTMLIMGRDHTLFYEAYNDVTDLDGYLSDGSENPEGDIQLDIGFEPGIQYFGYFDSKTCYNYNTTDQQFEPQSQVAQFATPCTDWHGNFLNYVTMTRLDVLRKVIYGGKRVADTDGYTVLERAEVPRDSHAWAKQYPLENITTMAYNIADYAAVPGNPEVGKYHLFASVGKELWIRTDTTKKGRDWASQERKGSKDNGILSPEPSSENKLRVRVKVCTVEIEGSCELYPNGNIKPTGILQKVGAAKNMSFGLITGSYDRNLSGGVLRKNIGPVDDEIDSHSGIISTPSSGGNIVTNLNKLKIINFGHGWDNTEYKCGWVRHEPGTSGGMKDDRCNDWGNPIGEMIYESLRYYSGAAKPTKLFVGDFEEDHDLGLTTELPWQDPFDDENGDFDSCLVPYNLVLSDLYPSYDGNGATLGSGDIDPFKADFSGEGSDIKPDMAGALTTISTKESIAGEYFFGQLKGSDVGEYNPTAKAITNLSEISGLGPFYASQQGSYSSAAMAYWGRVNDIRPDTSEAGIQTVQTLVVAMAAPLPEFNFTFGDAPNTKEVSIIPFAKSPATSRNSGQHINKDDGKYQPTNAVLDFYVVNQTNGIPTEVLVSFDDVSQGADHDLDAVVRYTFVPDYNANTLSITTHVEFSGSDATTQHIGYIIDGTSEITNAVETGDEVLCDDEITHVAPTNYITTIFGGTVAVAEVPGEEVKWRLETEENGSYDMYYREDRDEYYIRYDFSGDYHVEGHGGTSDNWRFPYTGYKNVVGRQHYCITLSYASDGSTNNLSANWQDWECPSGATDPYPREGGTPAVVGTLGDIVKLPIGSYVFEDKSVTPSVFYNMQRDPDNQLVVAVYLDNLADNEFAIYEVVTDGDDTNVENKMVLVTAPRKNIETIDERSNAPGTVFAYQFQTHNQCTDEFHFCNVVRGSVASLNIKALPVGVVTNSCPAVYGPSMNSDGIYLEVTDQGIGYNHSPAVAYYLDTHHNENSYPDNRQWEAGVSGGGKLPRTHTRIFEINPNDVSPTATMLKSPLWYAAKWGSFKDLEGGTDNQLDGDAEWTSSTADDPDPDTFWLVTNASTLAPKLEAAFSLIIKRTKSSNTSLAVTSGRVDSDALIYKAMYDSATWSGDLIAYKMDQYGQQLDISAEHWSARTKIAAQFSTDPLVAERVVLTTKPGGAKSLFTAADMKDTLKDIDSISASEAAELINYIRGSTTNDEEHSGSFRSRIAKTKDDTDDEDDTEPFVLGDIVHSTPVLSGKPSFYYDDASYKAYYKAYENRSPVMVFGANDGMVHVIDANRNGANGGKELFAYIPSQMYKKDGAKSRLSYLADPDFSENHKYYVDGPVKIVDAKDNATPATWHTLAIGSLGGGGKGYYALDITDPDPANNADWPDSFTPSNLKPVLWERTDLGHAYGQIAYGKMLIDGNDKWVALLPNGYGGGSPKLHVVDIFTGLDIDSFDLDVSQATYGNGCDTTATDGGLSPVTVVIDNDYIKYAYAGDLKGNMWKFDFANVGTPKMTCLFTATDKYNSSDTSFKAQPITVAPAIGYAPPSIAGYMLYFGTGKYNQVTDKIDTSLQSFYAVLDDHSNIGTDAKAERVAQLEPLILGFNSGVREITGNAFDYKSPSGKNRGFYFDLSIQGEKNLVKSTIFADILQVATLAPDAVKGCDEGCGGWLLSLQLLSGKQHPKGLIKAYKDPVYPAIPVLLKDQVIFLTTGDPVVPVVTDYIPPEKGCQGLTIDNKAEAVVAGSRCNGPKRESWRHIY